MPLSLSPRNVGQDVTHMPGNVTDTTPLPLLPAEAGGPGGSAPVGYLSMLDFFRVAVCACVLGQHSFLWTDMATNDIGTGFITILHFTRNAFFFLTGLVVCYAQITRPRSIWGFWTRRYIQIGVPYLAWTVIYVVFTILRPGGEWDQARAYFWTDIRIGYYQLYVIVVLFQFYLVFPFLLKLLQSTSTSTQALACSATRSTTSAIAGCGRATWSVTRRTSWSA